MKIHAITFANQEFSRMAKILGLKIIDTGFQSFRVYTSEDFSDEFRLKNCETLKFSRGAGYWVWKPHIIQLAASQLPANDLIAYFDAGTIPRVPIKKFRDLITDDRIHVWQIENSRLREWAEPSVLLQLNCPVASYDSRVVQASGILARNSSLLRNFLNTWQDLCDRPEFLRPETLPDYSKGEGFLWHRHDMTLLNIIISKHPEWFIVHGADTNKQDIKYFYQHRNLHMKYFLVIPTFYTLRIFRNKVVDLFPYLIRVKLREYRTLKQKKNLTESEITALRKIY